LPQRGVHGNKYELAPTWLTKNPGAEAPVSMTTRIDFLEANADREPDGARSLEVPVVLRLAAGVSLNS
jgi:hypothetical protein